LSIESLRPEDSGHMSIDRSTHACVPLSHGRTRVCLAFVHVSYVHGGVRDDTTMAESCLALAPEFSRVVSFDYDDADICQSRFSWSFSCASPDSQIRRITLAKWRHMQRKERGDELHSSFCEICCRLRERERERIYWYLASSWKRQEAGGRHVNHRLATTRIEASSNVSFETFQSCLILRGSNDRPSVAAFVSFAFRSLVSW